MPASTTASQIVRDGDTSFLGLQSRRNPLTIKEGFLQGSVNMRLDRAIAQTRKGAKRLASGISAGATPLTLPFTLGAAPAGPTLRNIYTGGIFNAGVYSSPVYANGNEYIVLVGPSSVFLWRWNSVTNTQQITTLAYPITGSNVDIVSPGDAVSVVQAFDKLFLFRWRASDLQLAVSSVTVSGTTATVTMPAAHGFSNNDVVRVSGTSAAGLNTDATIIVTGATTFTYTVASGTASNTASSGLWAQRVQCPLYWDGITSGMVRASTTPNTNGPTYSNLVAPYGAIACYFNNQLVIANRPDNLIVSDVLNPFNFDPMTKALRTNVGSNDRMVAIWPVANGQLLVLLRKSIYLATLVLASDGVSIDPNNSSIQLLTQEVGCVARQSVATAGLYYYFLSDNGVYRLDNSQIDLAIRGNTMPLSEPIADVMATINVNAVANATSVYFNNRFWLAVPTVDAAGNPSAYNNTLLIYNQLNSAWESVDTYAFSLDQLIVLTYGNAHRLFVASSTGTLMLLDEYDAAGSTPTGVFGDDAASGSGTVPVSGSITTRRYFYGQLNPKRINKLTASVLMPPGTTVNLNAILTDRDSMLTVGSVTNPGSVNDYTIKAPVRKNAEYLDVQVTTSGGRPTIRAIMADASLPVDPSTSSRTES
jgi:hypothetical protein